MIEPLLLTAARVSTFEQQRPLTNATGFFFERDERLFLVTSRHVMKEEASEHFPQACSEVLALIRQLYDVERELPGTFPGDEQAQKLRLRLRKERSAPLLDSIWQWAPEPARASTK